MEKSTNDRVPWNSLFLIVLEDETQKRLVNIFDCFSPRLIWANGSQFIFLCVYCLGAAVRQNSNSCQYKLRKRELRLNSISNLFPVLIFHHRQQTSAMNYARTENWIGNFTNPLKNWRRHAKPGTFGSSMKSWNWTWNRWNFSNDHYTSHNPNIDCLYIFPVADCSSTTEKISGNSIFWIWTIYSFSFLTWLTALYEKQPLVTV